jgi:hypothetical protein
MNVVKTMWEMVDDFTENPKHVWVQEGSIEELVDAIKEEPLDGFAAEMPNTSYMAYEDTIRARVAYHLIANSINYCYWYGRPEVRPNGANSVKMHKLLKLAFEQQLNEPTFMISNLIKVFKDVLLQERFPVMADRSRHLDELNVCHDFGFFKGAPIIIEFIDKMSQDIIGECESFEKWINELVKYFPGYGEDMFLKRASLVFMEMYRSDKWFKNDIKSVPMPIDYHIPNVLRHYGCISYSDYLAEKIENCELIQPNSLFECEIRACSMKACKMLAELSDRSMSDMDDFLFSRRKEPKTPFHLTITTSY